MKGLIGHIPGHSQVWNWAETAKWEKSGWWFSSLKSSTALVLFAASFFLFKVWPFCFLQLPHILLFLIQLYPMIVNHLV